MTPFEVSQWVFEWTQTYISLAWWGWWFALLGVGAWAWMFTSLSIDLGINPFAFPVVVVNRRDDD